MNEASAHTASVTTILHASTQADAQSDAAPNTAGKQSNGSKNKTHRPHKSTLPPLEPSEDNVSRWLVWLSLLGCLAVAAIAVLPDLTTPDIVGSPEAQQIVVSVETWHRFEMTKADTSVFDPIVPVQFAQLHLEHPPGVTWMHLSALSFRDQDQATAEQVLLSVRLTSFAMLLILLGSLFWAGHSVGGLRAAVFSAMVCLSFPVVLYEARFATPILAQMAFIALGMASALWAIRPLKPAPFILRQMIGWFVSAIAFAGAYLTGGLQGALLLILPLVGIVILCPRRFSHFIGLLACIALASLAVTPWALYYQTIVPTQPLLDMAQLMAWPETAEQWKHAAWVCLQRIGWMLVLPLPWTIWFVAVYLQPFSSSSVLVRRRMLIGWLWLLITTVLLTFMDTSAFDWRGLLLVLPPVALAIGQTFQQFSELSAQARHANLWQAIKWPFLVLLAIASIALPLFLHDQPWLVNQGWIERAYAAPISWHFMLAMIAVLGILVAFAFKYAITQQPGRSMGFCATWAIMLALLCGIPMFRGDSYTHPHQPLLQAYAQQSERGPVFFFVENNFELNGTRTLRGNEDSNAKLDHPDMRLVAAMGRPVMPVNAAMLEDIRTEYNWVYVFYPDTHQPASDTVDWSQTVYDSPWKLARIRGSSSP